ncbi:hypothetical protein [Flavobacterium anhuiense]|uniref:hypothetical protein n=1 Tax=Flavobacterium anhuiense TaxID=459526 RepID=UPI003D95FC0A
MDKTIIENLKILSENFKHTFDTFSNSVIFVNDVNKIRVQLEDETNFRITYNLNFDEKVIVASEETVYHFCLNLFKRQTDDLEVILGIGKPIEIDEWFQMEKKEALDVVNAIQKELDYNYRLKHLFLETSRFEITYFNGLLVLEDKQKEYFSNVFNFRNITNLPNDEIVEIKCRVENCQHHYLYENQENEINAITAQWKNKHSKEENSAGLLEESPKKNQVYELLIQTPMKIDLNKNFWVVYFDSYSTFEGIDSESGINSMLFCLCRKVSVLEIDVSKLRLEIEVLNVLDLGYSDNISTTKENSAFLDEQVNSAYYTIENFQRFSKISINIQSDVGWTYIVEKQHGKSKIVAQNVWDFHQNIWKLTNENLTEEQEKKYGITP